MTNVLKLQRLDLTDDGPQDCSLVSYNCSNTHAEVKA